MGQPYIGEIRLVSFNFAPRNWALCNGQTLPINQNQALFSVLGFAFGGDLTTNFKLPNLQGRVPVGFGTSIVMGQQGGETSHTIVQAEVAAHQHSFTAQGNAGAPAGSLSASPSGRVWGKPAALNVYAATKDHAMHASAATIAATAAQAHNNMQPYLVLNYVIALVGIFPSM